MQNLITRAWVSMETKAYMLKNRAKSFGEGFKTDERGVGAMVATILIMLIVVLLAAFFWEESSAWFEGKMAEIFDAAEEIKA